MSADLEAVAEMLAQSARDHAAANPQGTGLKAFYEAQAKTVAEWLAAKQSGNGFELLFQMRDRITELEKEKNELLTATGAYMARTDRRYAARTKLLNELVIAKNARIAELEAALQPMADAHAFWTSQFCTSEVVREPAQLTDLWRKSQKRKPVPQITVGDLTVAADLLAGDARKGNRGGEFGDSRPPRFVKAVAQ